MEITSCQRLPLTQRLTTGGQAVDSWCNECRFLLRPQITGSEPGTNRINPSFLTALACGESINHCLMTQTDYVHPFMDAMYSYSSSGTHHVTEQKKVQSVSLCIWLMVGGSWFFHSPDPRPLFKNLWDLLQGGFGSTDVQLRQVYPGLFPRSQSWINQECFLEPSAKISFLNNLVKICHKKRSNFIFVWTQNVHIKS